MLFNFFFFELKKWWTGDSIDPIEEFEQIESKHTRVHHDERIYETIRVH
jgi:hypothetical protein